MQKHCSVPNCNSNMRETSMHKFPKNQYVGELWIEAIGNPLLVTFPYNAIHKQRYTVCNNHFDEDAWFENFTRKRLKFDAVPTLHLPNLDYAEDIRNFRKKLFCQNDIPINVNENKDTTIITDIFSLNEFSTCFKYSDSLNLEDVTKLPIRGRDICENAESEISIEYEGRPQVSRIQVDNYLKENNSLENLNRSELQIGLEGNLSTSELQNVQSNILANTNNSKSDFIQNEELRYSETSVEAQLEALFSQEKTSHLVKERRKRPRLEMRKEDVDITKEPGCIQIERIPSNSNNVEKENAINIAAIQILESDHPLKENFSILKTLNFNEEVNKEGSLEREDEIVESNQLLLGEAKHVELTNERCEERNTGVNLKKQKYRTTIRLKRQSYENGKVQEDVFSIEHTFTSTCNICPNHENDKVSCRVVKIE